MTKELFIKEIWEDYQVKDSKTFSKDRVKHLKKMQTANVRLDEKSEPVKKRVKVKSFDDIDFIKVEGQWFFSCKAVVKVFN